MFLLWVWILAPWMAYVRSIFGPGVEKASISLTSYEHLASVESALSISGDCYRLTEL